MSSTKYADEGSVAHVLAAMCLTEGTDAAGYIGRLIECEDYEHAKLSPSSAKKWMSCPGSHALEHPADAETFEARFFSMEVTEDMAEYVQVYVDAVRAKVEQYKLEGAVEVTLLVEQKLPIGHITGEEGATGTGDAIIIAVWADGSATVDVGDLKTGMGVIVVAEKNAQLALYALGAKEEYGLLYDINSVRLTIYQPRLNKEPDTWEVPAEQLVVFETNARTQAALALAIAKSEQEVEAHLNPGDHCSKSFCKARATCPKLAKFVEEGVGADFEVLASEGVAEIVAKLATIPSDQLGAKQDAVDIIEDFCRAVRAETERRLLTGQPVPSPKGGYKLVQGKRGARAWGNAEEVEATFKSMRLKQEEMYDFKLISPTTAEKLLKDSPKRWNRVLPLVTQSEGKPSVAPESDKRPALVITPVEDDFDVVAEDLAG